jgi:hypothetical protein
MAGLGAIAYSLGLRDAFDADHISAIDDTALAQQAAEKRSYFTDFAEELLTAERESRRARAREMFAPHRRVPRGKDPGPV